MRDGLHIFNHDIILTPCEFDGSPIAGGATPQLLEENTIFSIRSINPPDYIITIPKSTRRSEAADAKFNSRLVVNANGVIYFKLSQNEYLLNAERFEKHGSFTVGAATTLIKIRPGRKEPKDGYTIYSEFGNDFNIGVSAGWKFKPNRRKQVYHSVVGGLSFSSIKVTPYSTNSFITSESTQGCITFSAGYVFEYNKFQVSIFSGLDVMSGEVGRKWIYKDRPWIGLGFGVQIFRAEGTTTN